MSTEEVSSSQDGYSYYPCVYIERLGDMIKQNV